MVQAPIAELEARLAAASDSPDEPLRRIDALNELAWELRGSDVSRSNTLASEARELAIVHQYKLGQARAARTMAMTIRDEQGLKTMFSLAEEARRLFDEVGEAPGRAGSRDFLSSLHELVGDLTGGLELALDALSIARQIGDPVRQGYALSSVGGILAASGEVEAAVDRLREALSLFEKVEDLDGIATISSRLARVLKNAGRTEEALTYAEMCRQAAEANQDEYGRWAALSVMAEVERDRGDSVRAERLFRAALGSLKSQPGRSVVGAETQIALGRLLIERGSLADAEAQLGDVLAGIEDNSVSIVAEAAAHEALAELYESMGKLADTVEHLRKAQELRQRISARDGKNKLAQVEVRTAMETAKRDAEIHKLRFVELHDMQSKLVGAEKMALLGKLAAGTAHELNTPLGVLRSNNKLAATAVQRFSSLLQGDTDIAAEAKKLAKVLESCRVASDEAVDRIAAIAQSFTRFSQPDQAELQRFDVRVGLESALALLRPTISEDIKLERHFADVPKIEAWPRELNHAFLTVLQNAAQAVHGSGVISIETRATEEQVVVHIRDTGRGMSVEQAAHLFDVSWSEEGTRTKMRLGLSAAYTTMQKHEGTLEVESALGQGTTVTFRFPRKP